MPHRENPSRREREACLVGQGGISSTHCGRWDSGNIGGEICGVQFSQPRLSCNRCQRSRVRASHGSRWDSVKQNVQASKWSPVRIDTCCRCLVCLVVDRFLNHSEVGPDRQAQRVVVVNHSQVTDGAGNPRCQRQVVVSIGCRYRHERIANAGNINDGAVVVQDGFRFVSRTFVKRGHWREAIADGHHRPDDHFVRCVLPDYQHRL